MPVRRWRAAAAALAGGVYSLLAVFPRFGFLLEPVFKLTAGVVMAAAAFGIRRHFIRVVLVFFAVSAAFAGAVMAAQLLGGGGAAAGRMGPVTLRTLALSFAACLAVFSLAFRSLVKRRVGGEISELVISLNGKTAKVAALSDSGNSLTDPVTGKPVTICSLASVGGLFPPRVRTLLRSGCCDPSSALRELGGVADGVAFRLLPYSAVGTRDGLLLAFRPDSVRCGGLELGGLVAVAPDDMIKARGYSAITGVLPRTPTFFT